MTTTPISAGSLTLVSDPARAGLTIIPGSTALTRLNYFDGKFLRADDLRLDQDYHRRLAALSVRGSGSGIVHGFEVEQAGNGGDTLLLRAGLAVTPSGHVVYLPADAQLTLAALLSKSGDTSFDPARPPVPGTAGFAPCAGSPAGGPDVALAPQPAYIITLGPDEAYCGEEERFGGACADACLTETDRPRLVQGVRVRARRLDLSGLPGSSAVTFTAAHYRSRIAAAYFAAESRQTPHLISGTGLESPAWCAGAEPYDGEEVPVALVATAGGTIQFIDLWTARRELMEEPARRYWAMRMDMRPWDVYLAHILQFQCQLRDAPTHGGGDGTDPCAGERSALRSLHDVVADLSSRLRRKPENLSGIDLDDAALARFQKLAAGAAKLLTPPAIIAGSQLIGRGFIGTPSAGYLPVDPAGDVAAQVHSLFGPGVDLRFCTARADVIPHLLEEAQHMERISLTAGLDDPDQKPQVDVIIPDGRMEAAPAALSPVYTGIWRWMPRARKVEDGQREPGPPAPFLNRMAAREDIGSAFELQAVAREVASKGWTWAMAAYGEAEQALAVGRLLAALLGRGVGDGAPADAVPDDGAHGAALKVPIFSSAVHARRAAGSRLVLAANAARLFARARRMRLASPAVAPGRGPAGGAEPDRPLAADEARPMAAWFDFHVEAPVATAAVGMILRASARGSFYSRAATNPVLLDGRIEGTLRVTGHRSEDTQAGLPQTIVTTLFEGTVDTLVVGAGIQDEPPRSFSRTITWRFGKDESGRDTLLALLDNDSGQLIAFEASAPEPDTLHAALGVIRLPDRERVAPRPAVEVDDEWTGHNPIIAATIPSIQVASNLDLRRDDDALKPGRASRDLAEAAIESIGAELSLPGRDPQFIGRAKALLLPDTGRDTSRVVAVRDWVMFHRRRVIDCTTSLVAPPKGVRHYRAYHATVASVEELEKFNKLLALYARNAGELLGDDGIRASTRRVLETRGTVPLVRTRVPVADLGFELVGLIDFTEGTRTMLTPVAGVRAAWSAQDRGTKLLWQGAGDVGNSDGDELLRQRVDAYRGAVASLIDTTGVPPTEIMTDVPDEFAGVGTDGAIFTIGLKPAEPPQLVKASHLAVRVTEAELKRVLEQAGNVEGGLKKADEETLLDFIQKADVGTETLRILYEDEKLTDPMQEMLKDWWTKNNGVPAKRALVLVPTDVLNAGGHQPELSRAGTVMDFLGGDPGLVDWTAMASLKEDSAFVFYVEREVE